MFDQIRVKITLKTLKAEMTVEWLLKLVSSVQSSQKDLSSFILLNVKVQFKFILFKRSI